MESIHSELDQMPTPSSKAGKFVQFSSAIAATTSIRTRGASMRQSLGGHRFKSIRHHNSPVIAEDTQASGETSPQHDLSFTDINKDEAEAFVQQGADLTEIQSKSCVPWICGKSSGSKAFCRIDPSWQAIERDKGTSGRQSLEKIFLFDIKNCFALIVDDSQVTDKTTVQAFESFTIVTSSKRIQFCAASRHHAKMWVTALQLCLLRLRDHSSGIQLSSFLRYQFQKADVNHDGKLTRAEVRGLFRNLSTKPNDEELGRTFTQFDKDNNGFITEDEFFSLLCVMMVKESLRDLFVKYSRTSEDGSRTMSKACFRRFLGEVQGMSESSIDAAASKELKFDNLMMSADGEALTEFGFGSYLCRAENSIFEPRKAQEGHYQDMTQPLSHYWINCSHNTYLEGSQFFGTASVEQYIEVSCQGCRCVEIDCCDGRDGEPEVTHVHTLTNRIRFERVVRALNDHAFLVNKYPMIVSLENKCSDAQTGRLGQIMSSVFGDRLLLHPESGHKGQPLVSPAAAMGKIIIKAKLRYGETTESGHDKSMDTDVTLRITSTMGTDQQSDSIRNLSSGGEYTSEGQGITSERSTSPPAFFSSKPMRLGKISSVLASESLAEFNRCVYLPGKSGREKARGKLETGEPCEITSFKDEASRKLSQIYGSKFNTYHRKQLTRVYPPGTNIQSKNLSPMLHWLHGVQLVALNYQTPDMPMVLQEAMFRCQNGGCGYVLKPDTVLHREEKEAEVLEQMQAQSNAVSNMSTATNLNAVGEKKMILPVAPSRCITLSLHVYSAHFLPKPRGKEGDLESLNPFVVITMHADVMKKGETSVKSDGFAPCFNEKLKFEIPWPEVTLITFEVYHQVPRSKSRKFIAAAAYPVHGIRSGLRWVPLWDYRRNYIESCGLLVEVTKYPEEAEMRCRKESDFSLLAQDCPIQEVKEEIVEPTGVSRETSELYSAMNSLTTGVRSCSAMNSLITGDRSCSAMNSLITGNCVPTVTEETTDVASETAQGRLGDPGRRTEDADLDFLKAIDSDIANIHSSLHAVPIQPPLLEDVEHAESVLAKCMACGCGSKPQQTRMDPFNISTGTLTL